MPLYQGFVQDEIVFIPNRLKWTVGTKLLNNIFTGFEIQPGTRLAWTPGEHHTIWTAVSRAVRTPSRFDADITISDNKFESEKVNAYELGYRIRPVEQLSLSLAAFYSEYPNLRSIDTNDVPIPPIIIANSQHAKSYGGEMSFSFQATKWWRLRGGYTYLGKTISPLSDKVAPISHGLEAVDPKNTAMLQSVMDLPWGLQFDLTGRYVDILPAALTAPVVPAYYTVDARFGLQFKQFRFSLVGQNLINEQKTESGLSIIPRSIYGRITCQF